MQKNKGGLSTKGQIKQSHIDMPLITVITAVYNGEKFLEESIKSVIDQNYSNVEYIIIDGGSADKTISIITKYEDDIDYWISEPDRGMYDAINKGIRIARGEYIANLNSDDYYCDNNVISHLVEFIRANKKVDAIYGDIIRFYENTGIKKYSRRFQVDFHKLLLSQHSTFVAHPSLVVKKKVYLEIGLFNTRYRYAGDFDFILKLMKKYKVIYLNIPIETFRLHESSITYSGKINSERIEILEKHGLFEMNYLYRSFMFVLVWVKYKIINYLTKR